MADAMIIDPELAGNPSQTQPQPQPQPRAESVTLPIHNHDDPDNASDGDGDDGNEASEKRRKLNLWKCQQCRDARKKCLPEDRVWPQKCQRCVQHRPDELDCSEPQLNTRKRGPNLTKSAQRSKSQSTPEAQEILVKHPEYALPPDEESTPFRPTRTNVVPRFKRELDEESKPVAKTPPAPSFNKDDLHPASAYLPLGDRDFRILYLRPGRKEDKVVCSFDTATIGQSLEYEAVSYLYGGNAIPHTSVDIKLMDPQGKSHPIFIRSNLHSALRSLRHYKDVRAFWIDALCVNHSNPDERSKQVAMKRYIFHNAANICFWLGPEDETSKAALSFIPRILDLTKIDELVKDDTAINGWVAFVALLKNPVFSRLWLVQEVAVAQNVTLHCGQSAIHYGDLVDAVAMFLSFRDDISHLFRSRQKDARELSDRKMRIAERFIDVSTNALRLTNPNKDIQRLLTLEDLVSHLGDLSATDARDRIFSVLAIAKDGPSLAEETLMEDPSDTQLDGALRIDYTKDLLEVYQDFVIHAITKSKSLDIICRHWASSAPEEKTFPTWVRPLQSALQPTFDSTISERTDPDSLVGLPDHNYYHASRGTTADFRIAPPRFPRVGKSLFVKGFRIDTISKLGPRASEGIILYEWLELGGCVTVGETAPEDFWRTLVADRGPNGTNAPSWYTRAFLYCLHHLSPTGDINTNRLIAECEASSSLVVDFLQRVQSVIWNRKFLVSGGDRAWKGLAPMAAQVEDVICILYGCSVPVVLRPRRDEEGVEYWQLVGECYVHGLMDGEAAEIAAGNPSEYREQEFEIR